MSNFITMTFDEWEEKYRPMKNSIDAAGASFQDESGEGIMYETCGEEELAVQLADPHTVWTYTTDTVGGTYIRNGFSMWDRIGYFITEVPFNPDDIIEITVSEGEEEDEDEGV